MTTIRILHRAEDGKVSDGSLDFDLNDFGDQVPAVGDQIVNPGVLGSGPINGIHSSIEM